MSDTLTHFPVFQRFQMACGRRPDEIWASAYSRSPFWRYVDCPDCLAARPGLGDLAREPGEPRRPAAPEADREEPPGWLVNLVRAAALAAEELACAAPDEHDEGCDRCAWDALYCAVPQAVKAAAERAEAVQ